MESMPLFYANCFQFFIGTNKKIHFQTNKNYKMAPSILSRAMLRNASSQQRMRAARNFSTASTRCSRLAILCVQEAWPVFISWVFMKKLTRLLGHTVVFYLNLWAFEAEFISSNQLYQYHDVIIRILVIEMWIRNIL